MGDNRRTHCGIAVTTNGASFVRVIAFLNRQYSKYPIEKRVVECLETLGYGTEGRGFKLPSTGKTLSVLPVNVIFVKSGKGQGAK